MPNPVITNYNTGSLVVWDGIYADITLYNSGAATFPEGQILAFDGINGANYKITDSTITDPDQANAKAVLAEITTFTGSEPGSTKLVRAIIGGKVDAGQLVFEGSDDLDTVPVLAAGADSFRIQLRAYGIIAENLAQQNIEDNQ